jgi:hypothetical protein
MNNHPASQAAANDTFDEELILTFLTEFHLFERALIRAGFTKAGRTPGNSQPDWARFARHIESHFHPDSSPDLQGAVSYLLCDPGKLALRRKRLQSTYPGETYSPHSDLVWLSELVQEAGKQLTHGINAPTVPGYDTAYIMSALLVLEAFSYIDPMVESLLTHVQ